MTPFRSLLIFAAILIVLRRVFAVPVSVGGSIAITLLIWFVMSRLDKS